MIRTANPSDWCHLVVAARRAAAPAFALWLLIGQVAALAGSHTWTGGSSGLWSDPLNWNGGAPQPDEAAPITILIPSSAPAHRELTNDVPGLTVQHLTISAHANTLHAAPGVVLRLRDATLAGLGNATIIEATCRLELSGVNHLQGSNDFVVRGLITEASPGAALHVSGNVRLETASRHSGATHLSAGSIFLLGSLTNTAFIDIASNTEVTLAADFTILTNRGRLRIAPEAVERPATSRLFGQGLVCLPGSTNTVTMIDYPALDSDDPADGGRLHSRLMINGPVMLAGRLEATTDLTQDGLRFRVLQNLGPNASQGQFDDLPEGALSVIETLALLTQRISYRGESGREVTLTFVQPPVERRLAGPWRLENGWLQILGGIAAFEVLMPHQWQTSTNLSDPTGWTPLGEQFNPALDGTILTITNPAAFPHRFFRLKRL